jgi:hypothetical protein
VPEPGWGASVEQVIHDLEAMNHSTERDFLAIGEKLMGFRSAARQIAADMAALTDLISGEHSQNASSALNRLLEHAAAMDGRIEHSGRALQQVRDLSGSIRGAFGGLPHTVAVFRTLCTLTRIETSRLGNSSAGFGDLAAEASPLSEMIRSRGEGVLEASSLLDLGVRSAMQSGTELRARQLAELPALISQVRDGLKAFEERRQRAIEVSARQAAQYEGLCDAIERVVTSLQFHDITRQQVEHVVEALRRLPPQSDTAGPILKLQAAQLAATQATFRSSIEVMENDLEGFAADVQEMTEASRSLMDMSGMSSGGQDSFFLHMESHFAAILTMLGNCATTQSEMDSTVARLESTIARMRDSVSEINSIGIKIHRISVNAALQATHIGVGGEPLNVIAEVMLRLALESSNSSDSAAASLHAMSDAVRRASGDAAEKVTGIAEIMDAISELHASSVSSCSRVHELVTLGERLAREIGPVRAGFTAGTLFSEVINHARAELGHIANHQDFEGADAELAMEALAKQYTMQAERDVHEAVVSGITAVKQGSSDLGDNVELF